MQDIRPMTPKEIIEHLSGDDGWCYNLTREVLCDALRTYAEKLCK